MTEALADRGWAPGYLTVPATGQGCGVVVLQDWWGLDSQVRSVVDRLAAEGHPAFAPDLYGGRVAADAHAELRRSGVEATFYLYPGTVHGFPDPTRPSSHHRGAGALSWQRTTRFLRERAGKVPALGDRSRAGDTPAT